jgi:hypothetical protein
MSIENEEDWFTAGVSSFRLRQKVDFEPLCSKEIICPSVL